MAVLTESIRDFLLSREEITDRVGPRVHQDMVPQGERRPYIYFERTGVRHERCMGDPMGAEPFSQTFWVVCVGDSAYEAESLAEAVRSVDGYPSPSDYATKQFDGVFVGEQDDQFDRTRLGSDAGRFVRVLTVEVVP